MTLGMKDFESAIRFVSHYYTPIGIQDYLTFREKRKLPSRPVLVTFDDAYASVALNAAPILKKYKVPAVFFVNSSLVGNEELALDNLVCYVANKYGMEVICSVGRQFARRDDGGPASFEQVFDNLLPTMSQEEIQKFRMALSLVAGISSKDIAKQTKLYVDSQQLQALAASGFEIGNHTYSHVFCRSLTGSNLEQEIEGNKRILESITNSKVQAFSVPYGSPVDMTSELADSLRHSGHKVAFLARDRSNSIKTDLYQINRISIKAGKDKDLFGEIEVLPRFRSLADSLLGRNKQLPHESCLSQHS